MKRAWAIWLITSTLEVNFSFTSVAIATNLSEEKNQSITHKSDLHEQKIGVYANSSLMQIADRFGGKVHTYTSKQELIDSLIERKTNAVIEDRIIAEEYLRLHPSYPVHLSNMTIAMSYFSFVLRKDSSLTPTLNHKLLTPQETGASQLICHKYLYHNLDFCAL